MDTALTHQEERFFLDNFNIDRVFNTIEKTDYLFLYYIKCCAGQDNRVYLSALAEAMNMKIPELSKAMEKLQSKGYVLWKTDHEAGRTYVELTSKAVELMRDAKRRMDCCYQKIREEIGPEKLAETIHTLKRINEILIGADAV